MAANTFSNVNIPMEKTRKTSFKFYRKDWQLFFSFVAMLALVIAGQIFLTSNLSSVNSALDTQQKITSNLKEKNDKLTQKIANKTNLSALQSYADKNGMENNEENVQNINK
ncbi:MAG: cell division protein FtsL [Lactobacillaceae bacterium]|jgi:cell division protein FtsL|nr:cell division protein FtsL [Lactobacillaceae bacterium]